MPRELCVWWIAEGDDWYRDFHEATLAWVRSLGLDPSKLGPRAGVVQRGDDFVLLYDDVSDRPAHRDDWDPLYGQVVPPASARREVVVPVDSWPDRRSYDVPLWAIGGVMHKNMTVAAA